MTTDDRSSDTCRCLLKRVSRGASWSMQGQIIGNKSGKTARQTDELAINFNELSVHL